MTFPGRQQYETHNKMIHHPRNFPYTQCGKILRVDPRAEPSYQESSDCYCEELAPLPPGTLHATFTVAEKNEESCD